MGSKYNRAAVLIVFMALVAVLVYNDKHYEAFITATSILVSNYVIIKGKNGGN